MCFRIIRVLASAESVYGRPRASAGMAAGDLILDWKNGLLFHCSRPIQAVVFVEELLIQIDEGMFV